MGYRSLAQLSQHLILWWIFKGSYEKRLRLGWFGRIKMCEIKLKRLQYSFKQRKLRKILLGVYPCWIVPLRIKAASLVRILCTRLKGQREVVHKSNQDKILTWIRQVCKSWKCFLKCQENYKNDAIGALINF